MTPFQQFRLWSRRAPVGERVAAGTAAAVVLALLIWVLVPAGKKNTSLNAGAGATGATPTTAEQTATSTSVAAGAQPGAGPAASAAPAAASTGNATKAAKASTSGGAGAGAVTTTTAGGTARQAAAASTGAAGCVSPPGSDQGVSASQIKIAITLVNIVGPAGNSYFGVPTTDEQQQDYQQVLDSINASGGAACRKLVAQFYTVNPADQSDQQQKCLDIVQAAPLFVLDAGGYFSSAAANCYPQHQIPFMGTGLLATAQRDQFYPYLFGITTMEPLYHNTVQALQQRGFFTAGNGFQKLGLIYRSCWPQVVQEVIGWLQQAGVSSAQLVTYDVGCPQQFANPSDLQQAILKFSAAGVTHVSTVQFTADFANFTTIAQQQGFKPKYGIPDDGIVPTSYGTTHPDYTNIADAIAIAADRYGEEHTPGLAPTGATQKCDAIYKAKGRPPVYQQPVGFGGVACDQLWEVAAAMSHAPSLQRTSMADGLRATKSLDLSYPRGPADFSAPKTTTGGQFWRPLQFFAACNCWKVLDATFHPTV